MAMTDDYGNCGNGDDVDDDTVTGVRNADHHQHHQHHNQRQHVQWPNNSSADIAEYDSSVAADTPSVPQQPTQFSLPHQQQRYRAANSPFTQRSADYSGGKSTIARTAAEPGDPATRGPKSRAKWKTGAVYVFLACLLAVVIVNLTLTLWFIRVTRFTSVTYIRLYTISVDML